VFLKATEMTYNTL